MTRVEQKSWSTPESASSDCPAVGRDGDQIADFVHQNGRVIRHRYRSALKPSLARMVETNDILSTVFRRTHTYLSSKPLRHESRGGLWRLIETITNRAAREHARRRSAAKRAEAKWQELQPRVVGPRQSPAVGRDLAAARDLKVRIEDDLDREIIRLRVGGMNSEQIAACTGTTPEVVRQRWSRLRRRIRARLNEEAAT